MIKISSDEIQRLLRVVDPSLRRAWENINYGGGSLMELQHERIDAIASCKYLEKKSKWWSRAIMLPIIMYLFILFSYTGLQTRYSWPPLNEFRAFVLFLVIVVVNIAIVNKFSRVQKDITTSKNRVNRCDEIFQKFQLSVAGLNPHSIGNIYYDLITNEIVRRRIVDFAARKLNAEERFNTVRIQPNVATHTVASAIDWVEKCGEELEWIWETAQDFGLHLDKGRVFKTAATQLAESNRQHSERLKANK